MSWGETRIVQRCRQARRTARSPFAPGLGKSRPSTRADGPVAPARGTAKLPVRCGQSQRARRWVQSEILAANHHLISSAYEQGHRLRRRAPDDLFQIELTFRNWLVPGGNRAVSCADNDRHGWRRLLLRPVLFPAARASGASRRRRWATRGHGGVGHRAGARRVPHWGRLSLVGRWQPNHIKRGRAVRRREVDSAARIAGSADPARIKRGTVPKEV